MPPRRSSRRGAVGSTTPRREEEEDAVSSSSEEEEEEEEDNFYSSDDSDDFDDSEEESDDGDRPGELVVTTAGGVRVVLARSGARGDEDEDEEEAERAARGRRRRRLEEEQQMQQQGRANAAAAASSDPATAAAAAASAARLAHELSLRCTPAGPRGSPALREMMLRVCAADWEQGEQQEEQQQQQGPSPPRPSPSPSAPPTPPPLAAASATLSAAAILRARERGGSGSAPGRSSGGGALSAAARAYLTTKAFAPVAVAGLGDDPRPSRAYVGFYTDSGNLFVCGYQNDRRVRVYECGPEGLGFPASSSSSSSSGGGNANGDAVGELNWRLVKDISCRLLRWTVTDALCVPGPGGSEEAKLLYSTISPTVHSVSLSSSSFDDDDYDFGGGGGGNGRNNGRRNNSRGRVTSIANTTDVHEPLNFDEMLGAPPDEVLPGFGIWSIKWNPSSGTGSENNSVVLAGASDGCCYLFDAARGKTVARYSGAHDDDVNAVVYLAAGPGSGSGGSGGGSGRAPGPSPDVFASGSDDGLIKVWDSRVPSGAETGSSVAGNSSGSGSVAFHAVARPVGVLVGHGAGITHLDSRGDGNLLLSNAKDQAAKLWDLRSGLRSPAAAAAAAAAAPPPPASLAGFDYRWQTFPRSARGWRHGADASAVTFRGHEVLSTLVRARFSPLESTGGRFAFGGSSDGRVRVWDLATGELVRSLPAGLSVANRAAARASRREEEEGEEGGDEEEEQDGNATADNENDGFGQLDPIRDVSWHPSGTALAAASFDGSITVFGPRGCRRRGHGGVRGGRTEGGGPGGFGAARRVSMLPLEDEGDDDEDYEPGDE